MMLNRYKAQVDALVAQKTKLIQDVSKVCPTSPLLPLSSSLLVEGRDKIVSSSSNLDERSTGDGQDNARGAVKPPSLFKSLFSRQNKTTTDKTDESGRKPRAVVSARNKAAVVSSPRASVANASGAMKETDKSLATTGEFSLDQNGRASLVPVPQAPPPTIEDIATLETNLQSVMQSLEKAQLVYQDFKKYVDRMSKTAKPFQKLEQQEAFKDGLKGLQVCEL